MKFIKTSLKILVGFAIFWLLLTLWVQYSCPIKYDHIGSPTAKYKALIVYNPDPIYNLDEQVCKGFAYGLVDYSFNATIASVSVAEEDTNQYDLYVFCANTYNWAPDWKTTKFIRDTEKLRGKKAVCLTLGSGSTARSHQLHEYAILKAPMNIVQSNQTWLLRPNYEDRQDEDNVLVAVNEATSLAQVIGKEWNKLF